MRVEARLPQLVALVLCVAGPPKLAVANDDDDHGNQFAPAPHPPMPQVQFLGTVLAHPRILSITYPGDPLQDQLDDFGAHVGKTRYWRATTSEYGVDRADGRAVHLTESPPASIADPEIAAWLAGKLDGTHPEFGDPDSNTVYTIYYPSGTKVFWNGGFLCQLFGAYHNATFLPSGQLIAYAVIPRCTDPATPDQGLDGTTLPSSHELVEAVSDPIPGYGYVGVNQGQWIWGALDGFELGDLCIKGGVGIINEVLPPGYLVQRTWSNAAAAASHDPCQPTDPGEVYFNSATVLPDQVTAFGLIQDGVLIAPGESKAIELDLYSDAPTSGPWSVSAIDYQTYLGNPAELGFSFDRTTGQNGDKLKMTITVLRTNPSRASPFAVVSQLGSKVTIWFAVVASP